MDEKEKEYFRKAEKAYTETEIEFDEKSRATESCDTDVFLLMLGELKRMNDNLENINFERK